MPFVIDTTAHGVRRYGRREWCALQEHVNKKAREKLIHPNGGTK